MIGSLAAAITGGATLVGGILQNNSAKAQANRQMEFQEDMSNTSYQRQMEDMRKAGLNPILSAKMGGASTPSGVAAPVENVVGPAVNSALATRMQNAQLENLVEANKKLKAETYQAVTQGVLNDSHAAHSALQMQVLTAQQLHLLSQAEKDGILSKAELDALKMLPLSSEALGAAKYIAPTVGKAAGAALTGVAAGKAAGFIANSAKSLPASSFKGGLLPPPEPVRRTTTYYK